MLKVIDADLCAYEIDAAASERERANIRQARLSWIEEDPASVAARYRAGELDALDVVRRYAVILDWGSGELLPQSTAQFRETFRRRSVTYWTDVGEAAAAE